MCSKAATKRTAASPSQHTQASCLAHWAGWQAGDKVLAVIWCPTWMVLCSLRRMASPSCTFCSASASAASSSATYTALSATR